MKKKNSNSKPATTAASRRSAVASGLDVSRFFSLAADIGGEVLIERGHIVVVGKDGRVARGRGKGKLLEPDAIERKMLDAGHIETAEYHRRWVMAQMFRLFRMAGTTYYDTVAMRVAGKGLVYALHMLADEARVLDRMKRGGSDQYKIRSTFFTTDVMRSTVRLALYTHGVEQYVPEDTAAAICRFVDGLNPPDGRVLSDFWRYARLCRNVRKTLPNLSFIGPYLDAGAYYTMQNLIMFHGCKLVDTDTGEMLDQYDSLARIDAMALDPERHKGLYAAMLALIEANHFDFSARMREIYAARS